jgi:hypothetical protein
MQCLFLFIMDDKVFFDTDKRVNHEVMKGNVSDISRQKA